MKKYLVPILLLVSPLAIAEGAVLDVNGMVCVMCTQKIKRAFASDPAVKSVEVILDKKQVKVEFNDGETLGDEELKTRIKDAGYDVVEIARLQTAPKESPQK